MTDIPLNPESQCEPPEQHFPRRYTIVARLGDQTAHITCLTGLKHSRKFAGRLSVKYPTEAVIFDIVRNPLPPTMPWRQMKMIVRAIVHSETQNT